MKFLALVAFAAFVLFHWVPVWHHLDAPAVAGLCSTRLGDYVQAASARAALDCSGARALTWLSWVCLGAALVLLLAAWCRYTARHREEP
jgi:hypothetical protein